MRGKEVVLVFKKVSGEELLSKYYPKQSFIFCAGGTFFFFLCYLHTNKFTYI